MSKYNIYSTREDWNALYEAVKDAGLDVTPFKKSQSYDMACVLYAEATGDYSLKKINKKIRDSILNDTEPFN